MEDMREELLERYELARGRILEIKEEISSEERQESFPKQIPAEIRKSLAAYVKAVCDHLDSCFFVMDRLGEGIFSPEGPKIAGWKEITLPEWQEINRRLYMPLADGAYASDYSNPDVALELGTYGEVLSFVLAELYSLPQYIFDGKLFSIVTLLELFLEIYGKLTQDTAPTEEQLRESVAYYAEDYAEELVRIRTEEIFVPKRNTALQIVEESDFTDPSYLYQYGEYITENEIRTAEFMNTLPEEDVDAMARTFTRGFRRGFETMNVPFEGKGAVSIRYAIGQERMVRRIIEHFREYGLEPVLHRVAGSRINRKGVVRQGFQSTPVSRQFEYDHRMDEALFLSHRYMERKLAAQKAALESIQDALPAYAGPAVIETFGEATFLPEAKDSCIRLSDAQQKLATELTSRQGQLSEEYLPGSSYSFAIISYPIPEIGERFEEIFRETVRINTLENAVYLPLQQRLIDAMDPADYILVEGAEGNRTRMKVKMRKLAQPEKETQFENCVADVNIPLGEVFTSPVLEGTEGVLHVSGVYLNGYLFKDLGIRFTDGCVTDYACGNYEDAEAGRRYIRENILFHHETLPIGEFAIGTNVPAYRMAKKYDILGKLPILIVEKTGPHFAVGDTCYSHAEDTAVFNPDGKEIVSRENSFSVLRDSEPEKAYFNCHTDITIPYEEIGRIAAVYPDGSEKDILRDGRFVLEGTGALNADE
ncbi:MAG: aminopeptidase [Eubacterium sp.]|nr:aminopeptidase [Eubacterium sp.]